MGFLYSRLMDFQVLNFSIQTFPSNKFFEVVYHLMFVKIHLYHSHVTSKILGYSDNFCNWWVEENHICISCLVDNFLGFDTYFLIKGIKLSAWETKYINVDRSNITKITFANVGTQVKFENTLMFYQKSLGQLSQTTT